MELYKNKFSLNGLLLVIVMVIVIPHLCHANPSGVEADNRTKNNYSHDGAQRNCSIWQSCSECAAKIPCSWQLDKQRCDDTKRLAHNRFSLAVHNSTQCPWLKPVQNWACGIFKYRVRIGNDQNGVFKAFLRNLNNRLRFCLDNSTYKTKVVDEYSEIEGEKLSMPDSAFVNSNMKSMVFLTYLKIDDNVRLKFDNEEDHIFTFYEPSKECSDDNHINKDCAECAWTADGLRHYAKWCAPSNTCTGNRTKFKQYDANVFQNNDNVPIVVVPAQCNGVRILSVRPLSAPSSVAGTVVSVVLRNYWILATSANRTMMVTVAGRPCERPITVDKETIKCTTTTTSTPVPVSGPVEVAYVSTFSDIPTFRFRSAETFRFVDPELISVSPSCGPVSGGTVLSVSGRHLDVGTAVQVSVGDNVTCAVVGTRRPDVITCVTGPCSGPTDIAPVRIQFDAFSINHRYTEANVSGPWFEYTVDPVLAPGQRFESIATGGTVVPVQGGRFSCVQNAQLYVVHTGVKYLSPCHVRNSSYMACSAPRLNVTAPTLNVSTPMLNVSAVTSDSDALPIPLRFGFQMNFNDHIFNMLPQSDFPDFHVYPDPEFIDFETQNDTLITINGRHLDRGYSIADDLIIKSENSTVVPGFCIVMLVQQDRIQCEFTSPSVVTSLNSMVVTIGERFNNTVPRKKGNNSDILTNNTYFVICILLIIIIASVLLFFILSSITIRRFVLKNRVMPIESIQTTTFSKINE